MNDGMNIGMIDMHIEDWFIDIAILYLVRRLYLRQSSGVLRVVNLFIIMGCRIIIYYIIINALLKTMIARKIACDVRSCHKIENNRN